MSDKTQDMIEETREILRNALQLGDRADALNANSQLLGVIPEFDSMAVVTVLTMVEDNFGVDIDDDDVTAEVFESLGSLSEFIAEQTDN